MSFQEVLYTTHAKFDESTTDRASHFSINDNEVVNLVIGSL